MPFDTRPRSRPRIAHRVVVRGAAAVLAIAPIAAIVGACTSSTTTLPYTPITGIIIQSQSLVAGYGCGLADAGSGQVYRYAAVLTYAQPEGGADASTSQLLTLTNIFDCFADGVFENLPTAEGSTFALSIYAYDYDDYTLRAALPSTLTCVPGQADDAGPLCTIATQPLTDAQESDATWTTTCFGTQQSGAPVLATCAPLVPVHPVSAAADASTDASALADAPGEAAADGAPEGDAAVQDGGDAAAQGAGDAASDAGANPTDANSAPNDAANDAADSSD